jgi:anti-sigma B factor antagonist
MDICVHIAGNVIVLLLSGRFDSDTAPRVTTRLREAIACAPKGIVVDMSDVSFVDAAALASLMGAQRLCRERYVDLALCGLHHAVYLIFAMMSLETAFDLFVDQEHALRTIDA